jgi:ATP-dependent DNA helicase RecG
VAVVVVEPSDYPPVRFEGRTWIRVGPRRATATYDEEVRLAERRRHRVLPFDTRSMPLATADDLDLSRFKDEYLRFAFAPEVLAADRRELPDQLKSLRLLDSESRPTIAALLFFGKDPQAFLPGAYIQALRVTGDRLLGDNIRSERRLLGTLGDQIRQAEELFLLWNERRAVVGGNRREEFVDYPETALSVCPRTY